MKRFADVSCSSFGRGDGIEDAGAMGTGFLCSFPLPPHAFFPTFPLLKCFTWGGITEPKGKASASRQPPLHLPQWARWAPRRAGAGRWWCGCAPAAQPGAAACTRSAGTGKGTGCSGHGAQAASTERARQRRKTHLRFGINFCRMLQKEVNDFYVSVVAANMQRSVSHLEWT